MNDKPEKPEFDDGCGHYDYGPLWTLLTVFAAGFLAGVFVTLAVQNAF